MFWGDLLFGWVVDWVFGGIVVEKSLPNRFQDRSQNGHFGVLAGFWRSPGEAKGLPLLPGWGEGGTGQGASQGRG